MRSFSTSLPCLALVLALSVVAVPAGAQDAPVVVLTDRAKVFRIDAPADTIIIGNPAIADVTLHDRQTVVVTGKQFGSTNLVILDKTGQPIIDEIIVVQQSETNLVTVQRNAMRYSYACSPGCDPVFRIGDDKEGFETTAKQVEFRDKMAATAAGAN